MTLQNLLIFGVDSEPDVDHFSISISITKIRLSTMYFDSTGCATALLSNSLNTILLILTLSRFGQVCRLNIVQVRHVTSDDDVTDSHQRRTRRQ